MRNEVIRRVVRKYTETNGFLPILLEAHQIPYYGSLIQFVSNHTDSYKDIQRYIHKQIEYQSETIEPVTDRRKRRKGVATHA